MKKILTILVLSAFSLTPRALALTPDSTICPNTSNFVLYVNGSIVHYSRFALANKSDYNLQFKVDSTSITEWQNANTSTNDSTLTVLTNLQNCTNYILRVRAKCSDGNYTDWQTYKFRIGNCPLPCTPITKISFYVIDSIFNPIPPSVNIILHADFTGRSHLFIETKIDNVPNAQWTKNPSAQHDIISGLKNCQSYSARLISSCYDNPTKNDTSAVYHFSTPCFNKFSCVAPEVDQQIPNSFQFNLNADEFGKYETQYKLETENTWTEGDTVLIYAPLKKSGAIYLNESKFKPCKNYTRRARALCASGNSDWTVTDFKTNGCQPLCQKIDSIAFAFRDSTDNNGNKLLVTFISKIFGYSNTQAIQFRLENSQKWTDFGYYSTQFNYCGSYDIRIISLCTNTNTEIINDTSQIFRIKTPSVGCFRHLGGLNNFNNTNPLNGIKVKPNPSSSDATIEFQLLSDNTNVNIKIFNSVGNIILNTDLSNLSTGNYSQLLMETNGLTAGLYLISVQTNNDMPLVVRWIKF